ncbi:MAG: PEGA domain-containing protein [Methanomicrobiales archaeon]
MKLNAIPIIAIIALLFIVVAVPVSAAPFVGSLKITSLPSGATILIDNVNKGTSPVTLGNIVVGRHSVTLKKTGYNDYQTYVSVQAGKTATISATLIPITPTTGSVGIISSPSGATVLLDNVNKGTSPVTLTNIVAGKHTVTLQKMGYNDYQTDVTVLAGKTSSISATLVPVPPTTWIYQTPAGSTNAALLSGAKALMKGIYTYSSGAPDYLPSSYTNMKTSQTSYVVHASKPTSVVWAPIGSNQLVWKSNPGGKPAGWSGIVIAAGQIDTKGKPSLLNVKTDCSGFITSLFTSANTDRTTRFTSWTTGSPIPEAGCNDPQGSCSVPNPLNYYQLFSSGKNGWFQSVSLSDLQPGDIISWANTNTDNKASGHIMLVAAVSDSADNSKSREVVVIDETGSAHSNDTRNFGAGIGMGYARLATSPAAKLQFFWTLTSTTPQIGSIALGRAL